MSNATDSEIVEVKLTTKTAKGTLVRSPATIQYKAGRIIFLKSPFALKDEIKAMKGSRWHGFDEDPITTVDGRDYFKVWSIEDCQRNAFQLRMLTGEDVYQWFDRELIEHDIVDVYCNGKLTPPMAHQIDLINHGLTYHYQIWAAEMGTGKTLSAQITIQMSGVKYWWWVGPKTSLPNMKREFKKWGFKFDGNIKIEFMTYEAMTSRMDQWSDGDELPQGVVFDESSRLKGATSNRTRGAQDLANKIRDKYDLDGYVIEMSGTPSPKSPLDWWSQSEIAWPGFLREGSPKQLETRLAFMSDRQYDAGVFKKRDGWKDNEHKCCQCGETELEGPHELDGDTDPEAYHKFSPSVNEVALMYDRLKGLVVIKHLKDCISLPERRYRRVICKPTQSVLRVSSALMQSAPNIITGLTLCRELSDGFQYKEVKDGTSPCSHCAATGQVEEWFDTEDEERSYQAIDMLDPKVIERLEKRTIDCQRCHGSKVVDKMVRLTREVPCPKERALANDLETCEETGRIVIFAGFCGSVDRIVNYCRKHGWAVVRCDGDGFEVSLVENGEVKTLTNDGEESLEYWADLANNPRVAFVANPESGGMSLTLTEARMCVFWSNTFKPEYRSQAEARIHRKGMDENLGCEIVDYVHLPTDMRVLDVLRDNRKLELMSMGDFQFSEDGVLTVCDRPEDNTVIEYLDDAA